MWVVGAGGTPLSPLLANPLSTSLHTSTAGTLTPCRRCLTFKELSGEVVHGSSPQPSNCTRTRRRLAAALPCLPCALPHLLRGQPTSCLCLLPWLFNANVIKQEITFFYLTSLPEMSRDVQAHLLCSRTAPLSLLLTSSR